MKWTKITKENQPPMGECLVYLEEKTDGSHYHVAIYHPNLVLIGGHFEFDMPAVTHWRPLPEKPNGVK